MSGFFHCLVSLPSVNIGGDTGALFSLHLCTHPLASKEAWHVNSRWINRLPSIYACLSAEHQRQTEQWLPIITNCILTWAEYVTVAKEECCHTVTVRTWQWTDTRLNVWGSQKKSWVMFKNLYSGKKTQQWCGLILKSQWLYLIFVGVHLTTLKCWGDKKLLPT